MFADFLTAAAPPSPRFTSGHNSLAELARVNGPAVGICGGRALRLPGRELFADVLFRRCTFVLNGLVLFILFLSRTSLGHAQAAPTEDLVAYFPFNGNADDVTGNGHNGTVVGATLAPDRFCQPERCYFFNGSSHIVAPSDGLPAGDRTVSLWFRPTKPITEHQVPVLLGYGGNGCGTTYFEYFAGESFGIYPHCDTPGAEAPAPINTRIGQWHHLGVVTHATGIRFYYDGQLVGSSGVHFPDTFVTARQLCLGVSVSVDGVGPYTDVNIGYYTGYLDDVRIYGRALSDAELQDVFRVESPNPASLTVTLTNPINAAIITGPTNLTLTAKASELNGIISKVEFFQGTTKLGKATNAPYSSVWSNAPPGIYTLKAIATDACGLMNTSAPVHITISPACGQNLIVNGSFELFPDSLGRLPLFWVDAGTIDPGADATSTAGGLGIDSASYFSRGVAAKDGKTWMAASNFGSGINEAFGQRLEVALEAGRTYGLSGSLLKSTVHLGGGYDIALSSGPSITNRDLVVVGRFEAAFDSEHWTQRRISFVAPTNSASLPYLLLVPYEPNDRVNYVGIDDLSLVLTGCAAPQPPTITLTAPVGGAVLVGPTNLTLSALAEDPDGTISKVEFFQGATKLGQTTNSPYTHLWSNVPAGSYSLTAVATDNKGLVSTSAPVQIRISPACGQNLIVNGSFEIVNGNIIDQGLFPLFWVDAGTINPGADTTSSDGSYGLDSAYYFAAGTAAEEGKRWMAASNFGSGINEAFAQRLTVTLEPGRTYVLNGSLLKSSVHRGGGYDVALSSGASVTNSDLNVLGRLEATFDSVHWTQRRVTFVAPTNSASLPLLLLIPYEPSDLLAYVGIDDISLELTGCADSQRPMVTLTAPVNGAVLVKPTNLTLTATASDPDGTIDKVEFFQGATRLGQATNAPYTNLWSNVPAGSYTLTAVATDNSGLLSTSAPVRITVTQPACFTEVYQNDFQAAVGTEWSQQIVDVTPKGGRGFLGQFGNDTVTLSLAGLPPHGMVRILFKLFIIHSWDGNDTVDGPDFWSFSMDQNQLLYTTFRLALFPFDGIMQAYPDNYPIGKHPGGTGATEVNTLGYTSRYPDLSLRPTDSVYDLEFSGVHTNSTLLLTVNGANLQSLDDESWGLANVVVLVDGMQPPNLTGEPADTDVLRGAQLRLCVVAADAGDLTYQWRHGDAMLSNQTNACLVLPDAQPADAGAYDVVVKNCAGSVTSRVAQVRVLLPNTAPTLSALVNRTVLEDSAPVVVAFTVGDAETAAASLVVSATASNTPLLPPAGVVSGGSGTNRTLTLTPAKDQSGVTTISVVVKDGGELMATNRFDLTVVAVNDPPTLAPIADVVLNEDAPAKTVDLAGITTGAANETQTLTVTAISSNPALIPNPTTNYTSPNATGTLTFQPDTNASGTATITVTVKDNGGTANGGLDTFTRQFTVTVNPVNDPPTVTLTAPKEGESFGVGTNIVLTATANDVEGPVAKVEFYDGATKLGEDLTAPYAFTWTNAPVGAHTLTAKATDSEGATTNSAAVHVGIIDAANAPPVVAILSPAEGTVFEPDTAFGVTVSASDPDDSVVKVELLLGTQLVGSLGTAPWNFTVPGQKEGSYRLTARATDAHGATTVSRAVQVLFTFQPATLAIVGLAGEAEVQRQQEYLLGMKLASRVFAPAEATFEALSPFQLTIWCQAGRTGVTAAELAHLVRLQNEGRPLYFIGESLTGAGAGLNAGAQQQWRELLHLRSQAGLVGASTVQLLAASVPDFGFIADSLEYSPGVGYEAATAAGLGGEVLAQAGQRDVLVAYPPSADPDLPNLYRSLAQSFYLSPGDTAAGQTTRQLVFQAAVCWLIRCGSCDAFNLKFEDLSDATLASRVGEVTELPFVLYQRGCLSHEVELVAEAPPGVRWLGAVAPLGRVAIKGQEMTLSLGQFPLTDEADRPRFILRAMAELPATYEIAIWGRTRESGGGESVRTQYTLTATGEALPPRITCRLEGGEVLGGEVLLSWPGSAAGWTLEASDVLGPAPQWQPVPGSPGLVGPDYQLRLPSAATQRFFRLRK